MNKQKLKNCGIVLAFIFSVLLFFVSIFTVFRLSNKANNLAVKAMEIPPVDNPITVPYEERSIIGNTYKLNTVYLFNNKYFNDGRLYVVPFIANNEFFKEFSISVVDEDIIVEYTKTDDTIITVFWGDGSTVYESLEDYFTIQITGLVSDYGDNEIKYLDYINVIHRFFNLIPYEYIIPTGTYSLKPNLPAIPFTNFSVCLGEFSYGFLPNNTYQQLFFLSSINGHINLRNQTIIDSSLIRKGQSELITLTQNLYVSKEQYDFFNSLYELAPIIRKGEYRFDTDNFIYPNQSPFNFNYDLFARLDFNVIGLGPNYQSIYFKNYDGDYSLIISDSIYPNLADNLSSNETLFYNDYQGLLPDTEPEFSVIEDTFVSSNFYNYFISITDSYLRLNGSFVFNEQIVLPSEDLFSRNVSFGGVFNLYTSNESAVTSDFSEISVTTDGKITYYGFDGRGTVEITVYNLGWVDVNFKYVFFQNVAVTLELYDWLMQNTTQTANWDFINNAYNIGFNAGFDKGKIEGESIGFNGGKNIGYDLGFNEGYTSGLEMSDNGSLSGLILTVVSAPFNMIYDFLDFSILGYNLSGLFFSLLSLCVVIAIIRWII